MPVLVPDSISLPAPEGDWLIACFCAQWCDTCTQYRDRFEALAGRRSDAVFAWIDIEDHPDYLGEEDVENFPTLLLQHRGGTVFFGPMLPHIEHLERLMDALGVDSPTVAVRVPDVLHMLRHAHTA